MIIDQQIELYFGDDYPDTLKTAKKMVRTSFRLLVSWGADRYELMTNEGGRTGMLRTLLCYIIEEGDNVKGQKAFNKYLSQTYTNAYAQRRGMVDIGREAHRRGIADLSIEDITPLILADEGGIPEALTSKHIMVFSS